MDAAREADKLELQRMMLMMLENQEDLKEDMGILLVNMEKFTEIMKTFQLVSLSIPLPPLTSANMNLSPGTPIPPCRLALAREHLSRPIGYATSIRRASSHCISGGA
jgi:hypothetical protein